MSISEVTFLLLSVGVFLQFISAKTQLNSKHNLDFWIKNISPNCLIKFSYINHTSDLDYKAVYGNPIALFPMNETDDLQKFGGYDTRVLDSLYFKKIPVAFARIACVFNLIYFLRAAQNEPSHISDSSVLDSWIRVFCGGSEFYQQHYHLTYCLVLYASNDPDEEEALDFRGNITQGIFLERLALIFLNSFKLDHQFVIYCKSSINLYSTNQVAKINAEELTLTLIEECVVFAKEVSVYDFAGGQVISTSNNEQTMERIVLHEVFQYTNTSYSSPAAKSPLIIFNRSGGNCTFIPTTDTSVRIFTCYAPEFLSFHMYISAFERNVWIMIVLSGIVISTFLNLHIKVSLVSLHNFSSVLFFFSTFTEESYSIPSSLNKNKVYRVSSISWLLLSVILTNTYVSNVISGLNSPLRGTKLFNSTDLTVKNNSGHGQDTRFGSLKSVVDVYDDWWTNYSVHLNPNILEKIISSRSFPVNYSAMLDSLQLPNAFSVLSEPKVFRDPNVDWQFINDPESYYIISHLANELWLCLQNQIGKASHFCSVVLTLLSPYNRVYAKHPKVKRSWEKEVYARAAVEDEMIQCRKSVYLEISDEKQFDYLTGNYPKLGFYYLKDKIDPPSLGWTFAVLENTNLIKTFKRFIQSGVYVYLHKKLRLLKSLRQRMVTLEIQGFHKKEVTVGMTSSIQTIFILHSILIVLSCRGLGLVI